MPHSPTERAEPYFGGGLAFPKGTRGGSGRWPRARAPPFSLPRSAFCFCVAGPWGSLPALPGGGGGLRGIFQNHPTPRGVPAEEGITLSPGMGPRRSGIGTLDGLRPYEVGPRFVERDGTRYLRRPGTPRAPSGSFVLATLRSRRPEGSRASTRSDFRRCERAGEEGCTLTGNSYCGHDAGGRRSERLRRSRSAAPLALRLPWP